MNIILALIVGGIYMGVGRHASKALFNFGFIFTIVIAYLYLPMMPVLLQCKNHYIFSISDNLKHVLYTYLQFPPR